MEPGSIPAWDIKVLRGEITGAVAFQTGSTFPTTIVPKITLANIEYQTFVSKDLTNQQPIETEFQDRDSSGISTDLNFANKRFEDGTYIQVKDDYILLDIKEDNVDNKKENFDIEVYLVDTDDSFSRTNKEVLLPLYFEKKKSNIVNNILIDDGNIFQAESGLDPSFVSHFLNIFVDAEINPDILCQNLSPEERKSLTNEFVLDCEDLDKETLTTFKPLSDVEPQDIDDTKC